MSVSLSLRVKLAAPVLTTADQWFAQPIQKIAFEAIGEFSDSHDGAALVKLPDGAQAFQKPRPDFERNILIAREKICADLGHILGLPVAPVVVVEPDEKAGRPHHSMLSLLCLPSGRAWGAGGDNHIVLAGPALEALRVFWTWVGDSDHGGHGQNLVYEVSTEHCQVLSIDHAHSLCHGNKVMPLAVPQSAGYGTAHRRECLHARGEILASIQALDLGEIEPLVRRLGAILPQEDQDAVVEILKVRQRNMPFLLGN